MLCAGIQYASRAIEKAILAVRHCRLLDLKLGLKEVFGICYDDSACPLQKGDHAHPMPSHGTVEPPLATLGPLESATLHKMLDQPNSVQYSSWLAHPI
eukprot:9494150-Pyramimonas_sp.AAC.2